MRVAIVNQVGFDRGGATTLCLQYAKLGLDVWFNTHNPISPELIPIHSIKPNVYTYSTANDLISAMANYDRVLFLNLWYGKNISDTALTNLIAIREHNPDIELCYLHCFRKTDDLDKLLPICKAKDFMFDHIFSLNPETLNLSDWCPATIMDINAITLPKYSPVDFANRKQIVFSAGRTEAFKNTTKYIQSIDNDFLTSAKEFTYIHEGAGFNFNKSGGVSCQPQILSIFNLTSPKTLKSQYALKSYDESPEHGKFNLYPAYNVDNIQTRWKYYYAGVCCILGTRSGYTNSGMLFDDEWTISDSKERTLTEKKALNWNSSLEYADIEKIMYGVPVFFSRMYANLIGFTDERLIYNSFSEIPVKVNELSAYYDDTREKQYNWLVDKISGVNENVIKIFTGKFI